MDKIHIEINGVINTSKTHDEWLNDFIIWLESRNESFGGITDDSQS